MDKTEAENCQLRKLLWLNHGCPLSELYGDDGEMQCQNCLIDFKRNSVEYISDALKRKREFRLQYLVNPCTGRREIHGGKEPHET